MQKTILLIEDENDLAAATMFYLQQLGYVVHHCETGSEGLLRLQSQKWDILLLDWMLPDISGIEILQRISNYSPDLVFMLSARDSPADRKHALLAGADFYIAKPFSLRTLQKQLVQAFEQPNIAM